MTPNGPSHVDAPQLAAPQSAPQSAPADTAQFRRLLESLERLAKEHRAAPPVSDAGSVQEAIARADAGFSLAMDLRRQLEDAFRQRQP